MMNVTPSAHKSTPAVVVRRLPTGLPTPDDFAITEVPVPALAPGEVLVEVAELSIDPYLRSVLAGRHLDDPGVAPGDVMPGRSVGVVRESADPTRPVGTWVVAETGWRAYAVVPAAATEVAVVPDDVPRSAALGALGMPGLTAFAALERQLTPRAGETVVISSATGGVGSVAGALARAAGARTVAVVGSAIKAEDALRLGYDAAVVRTDPDWLAALRHACPDRVHAYLHMGDMPTLHGVLSHLAPGARVSLCGLMDQYNGGPRTMLPAGAIMTARATVYGLVVFDHRDLAERFWARATELLREGTLTLHEERHHGLDQAPAAFARLMSGQNRGKVVVEVNPDAGSR
ncbi:MAG: NADP-dependent oxidoreductase [Micromonosporaceae bacterium]|nr:NADP-dependent oxidoreductase [Micromonosporaceae bacterium]